MQDKIDNRLLRKPKYKIGDVVVYKETSEEDGVEIIIQSRIIESHGLLETYNLEDTLSWYYTTERTENEDNDDLYEGQILYSLSGKEKE